MAYEQLEVFDSFIETFPIYLSMSYSFPNFINLLNYCVFLIRSTTPQNWEDFSRYNKDRAEAEMGASQRLREAIHHTLQQTDNDLQAQHTNTDYAFRKRMHETRQAIDELNWQKQQVS